MLHRATAKLSERSKKLFYLVATTIFVKGINMLVAIISIPLTYNYLNKEEFGLLSLITSSMSLLSFSDLGIGFGLQSHIPQIKENQDKTQRYISTTWVILLVVSALFSIITTGIIYGDFFNITNSEYSESSVVIEKSLYAFAFCFFSAIPFSLSQRVQTGLQEGHITQIWNVAGNILSLIALLIATKLKMSLPYLILAIYGAPLITSIGNFIAEFFIKRNILRPKISLFDFDTSNKLLTTGLIFILSQIASSLLAASSNMIILNYSGTDEVADFSVILRFTIYIGTPIILILPSLLPSINDALSANDDSWIKKIYRKAGAMILIYSTIASFALWFWGDSILKLWINSDIKLFTALKMECILYLIYLQVNAWVSYIMLSSSYLKHLAKIYPIAVAFTIATKWITFEKLGFSGLIGSEIITMTFLYILPSLFIIKRKNHL